MSWKVLQGDCLESIRGVEPDSIDCICTSPPYWSLRDYQHPDAWGLEPTLAEYLDRMKSLGAELLRVLKPTGTFWLNMGDAYASAWPCSRRNVIGEGSLENGKRENRPPRLGGLKEKDLIGLPWRVAFMLQEQGWYLRSDIIWHKPNPMPESVTDRPTKAHEYVFLLTKSAKYFYDADAIAEKSVDPESLKGRNKRNDDKFVGQPGSDTRSGFSKILQGTIYETRNARTVWTIATQAYPEAHFATFPEELPKRCILAGCAEGGVVFDPFAGSGTTLAVAVKLGRNAIGCELNPEYIKLIERRMEGVTPSLFAESHGA